MKKTLLITETYLKDNSPISLNVEPTLITMAILDAQEIGLQALIGTKLYHKLQSLTGGTLDTAPYVNYATLVNEYVRPYVVKAAVVEALSYVSFKVMNKGVMSQNSENSTPADLDQLKYLTNQCEKKAEFLGQRLIDYLTYNAPSFPEYTTTNGSEMAPNRTAYRTGMFLGTAGNCDRYLGLNKNTIDLT